LLLLLLLLLLLCCSYIMAEVLNHRKLQHPFVIAFKEVFTTQQYICIVMEYASGRSLYE
jgi:serine/threonine-protein kinase SRK2